MHMIIKGVSTRQDGSMYVSPTQGEGSIHRERFLASIGLTEKRLIIAELVHGSEVAVVDWNSPRVMPKTDALITRETGIALAFTVADCFPVFFEDRETGVIALAHAGWRGIVAGIIPKTIAKLVGIGCLTQGISVTLGPGICTQHFEIQSDVLPHFEPYADLVTRTDGLHADLKGIIRQQLLEVGMQNNQITDTNECTYCLPEKYFSYRRDHADPPERQLAVIAL